MIHRTTRSKAVGNTKPNKFIESDSESESTSGSESIIDTLSDSDIEVENSCIESEFESDNISSFKRRRHIEYDSDDEEYDDSSGEDYYSDDGEERKGSHGGSINYKHKYLKYKHKYLKINRK